MTIVQNIFEVMNKKRITQRQLSEATGIPTSTIASWKSRNACPASDKIIAISNCLEISVSELLGIEENQTIKDSTIIDMDNFNFEQCQGFSILSNKLEENALFGPEVTEAYNKLSEREKLEIQLEIFKKSENK